MSTWRRLCTLFTPAYHSMSRVSLCLLAVDRRLEMRIPVEKKTENFHCVSETRWNRLYNDGVMTALMSFNLYSYFHSCVLLNIMTLHHCIFQWRAVNKDCRNMDSEVFRVHLHVFMWIVYRKLYTIHIVIFSTVVPQFTDCQCRQGRRSPRGHYASPIIII